MFPILSFHSALRPPSSLEYRLQVLPVRLDRPLQLALAHELVVQLRLHLDLLHQRAVHLVRRARAVESRQRRRVAAVVREPAFPRGQG